MSLSNNFPAVRPSLLLDFANTKTLDPRITFTRASTGTYYDGKTTVKAEENLITDSEAFNNWQTTNSSVTANSTTSPDGTSTADSVTENTATGEHRVLRSSLAVANATTYVFSVFAKQNSGTRNIAVYQLTSSNGWVAYVDLSTGSLVSSVAIGSGVGSASVSSVGNGWYRVSVVFTTTTTSLTVSAGLSNGTTGSYTGDGTSSIFVWGAQLEQRSSVTAYTATTTAPITNYIPALQTAAAGVARFEHNPVTGESLGLEIEEQRTNLLLRSEEIDNAYWTKANASITANAVVAPDGNLTADSLVENTAATGHNISSTAFTSGLTSAISYTFSVYVKPAGRSWAILEMGGALGGGYGWFDLSTGTLGTQTQLSGTSTITAVGNGWYRISITDTSTSTGSAATKCNVYATTGNNVISYTGDGFSGISVWGAQLEAGAFATSYIPTVASQVTRSADSASMTGTNFSSWYRTDEGTLYSESSSPSTLLPLAMQGTLALNDVIYVLNRGTGVVGTSASILNGIATQTSSFSTFTFGAVNKSTLAYKTNDAAASLNGGTVTTDSTVTLPSVSQAFIGAQVGTIYTGTIKKVAYYAKRLSNAEIQSLTTI